MPAVAQPKKQPRLSLNLSESGHKEVSALAEESSRSITELVRLALSLLKVILDERKAGHKLMVVTEDGRQKEFIIPGF